VKPSYSIGKGATMRLGAHDEINHCDRSMGLAGSEPELDGRTRTLKAGGELHALIPQGIELSRQDNRWGRRRTRLRAQNDLRTRPL
jgi:hypothetical protein